MEVRIKKTKFNAIMPKKAHDDDAGWDLYAISAERDEYNNMVYGTGWAFEIPKGYVGLLFPRSSISKKDLFLTNSVGVIDSGYRGEVMLKFKMTGDSLRDYEIGERIGQIIIIPYPELSFVVSDELSDTDRGVGGYGSTGK